MLQQEPELLPGRFPNLLVNGASGIAVGLATNIPPHNPVEAIDAVIAQIDNPKITIPELMKIMPAPDMVPKGMSTLSGWSSLKMMPDSLIILMSSWVVITSSVFGPISVTNSPRLASNFLAVQGIRAT